MGKRGPQPQPRALRVLRGDDPPPEPVPAPLDVSPPDWLGDAARGVWARLAGDLIAKGVLTAWDAEAFGGFCDAVTRRARAAGHLDVEGELIEAAVRDRNGRQVDTDTVVNPWWRVYKDADNAVQRWGARFGLTPTERAQITVASPAPADAAERLLTGGTKSH